MNCFQWKSHLSEFLDGTLIEKPKMDADEHLASCEHCKQLNEHFRKILRRIEQQPRHALPIQLRNAPFTAPLPKFDILSRRSRWNRMPWYIRTGAESSMIAIALISIVLLTPRIRSLYEHEVEKKLSAVHDEAIAQAEKPAHDKPTTDQTDAPPVSTDEINREGEFISDEAPAETGAVRLVKSEIWRFNIRTDSPRDARKKVVELLLTLKVPQNHPGLNGLEAPGGIQFDLLLLKENINPLKSVLEKIATPLAQDPAAADIPNVHVREPFTWFKSRSARSLPEGKVRVVIWLSQI